MSSGVIAFRIHPTTKQIEYLMICRKDTLGYIDFLRGKFSVYQKYYILNMIHQMTTAEKTKLRHRIISEKSTSDESIVNTEISNTEISEIYDYVTNINRLQTDNVSEASNSRNTSFVPVKDKIRWLINGVENKGEKYHLLSLIQETETNGYTQWEEPEWGFPKGRRNSQETDYDCALREFSEETGISISKLQNVRNVVPFEELFTGSNYKSYRHKYFLMYMEYSDSSELKLYFQRNEVSQVAWKSIDECIQIIRPYNLEKKRMIQNVDFCLKNTVLHYSNGVNI
jgi:8-oxo-dGTP pyrophosphatase MutT (NUDIX family)